MGIEELSVKAPKEYKFSKKVTRPLVTAMTAQSNTIPDKGEHQTLTNEAKLEKAWELQERSKQIEEALLVSMRQVIKQTNGRRIQLAHCNTSS